MTEYPNPVRIPSPFSRQVTGQFNDGTMTSDARGLVLREADRLLNLLPRLARCFLDGREPGRVQHSVAETISQPSRRWHRATKI